MFSLYFLFNRYTYYSLVQPNDWIHTLHLIIDLWIILFLNMQSRLVPETLSARESCVCRKEVNAVGHAIHRLASHQL